MTKISTCLLLVFACFSVKNSLFSQSRLVFDGFQDHVALVGGADFAPPWTVECWVQKSQISSFQHLLTSTDGTSGIRLEQYINVQKMGITKKGVADWQFNYTAPVGQWVHLAVTNDGASMSLFANGQFQSAIAGSIDCPMGQIGLNTTGGGALSATLDDLRIWKTALDETTIQQFFQQEIDATHPFWAELMTHFKMDEGTGPTTVDSKNGLVGDILGATWVPVFGKDVAASALVSPLPFVGSFSAAQVIKMRVVNNGSAAISENFEVSYSLDGGPAVSKIVAASTTPLAAFGSVEVSFPAVNLTTAGIHNFLLKTSLAGDQFLANDTLFATSSKTQLSLTQVTGFQKISPAEYLISSGVSRLKLRFYRDDIFRLELAPNGLFSDPTDGQIVVLNDQLFGVSIWSDETDFYKIETSKCLLKAFKNPLRFELFEKNGTDLIWKEIAPLTFGQFSRQSFERGADEQFYGCGMQNGYFSHRGKTVKIENDYQNWGDGAVPNPAPMYLSTAGYGAFRNTFSTGSYDFQPTVGLRHNENRFDCFYFLGNLKQQLEGYTAVTGRPFLPPRWALEFGDADCYNDTGTTADVLAVAEAYRQKSMPGGWFLPNDGYGCGYEKLDSVVAELHKLGFYTGLWSENSIGPAIAAEVGQAGTRLMKLDVALVGPGYSSAMSSGEAAFGGIESNSTARGFVWTVAGWAGTQRFATTWSGDQSGNFENIRFHIPTVIGAGLSGQNCATGDVDGIFGGSATTYARDLQWKCFTPALMTISGWAAVGKQPWAFGTANADINRKYLNLKNRLKPYTYSACREAWETGVPTCRAMVLEFPDDPTTWGKLTQYQFMSGPSLLVAPVFKSGSLRDSIYLPVGRWVDYWNGVATDGPVWLKNYPAPLTKLPLFVRDGAILPMYDGHLFDAEKPFDRLTTEVFPAANSEFSLYEDDGFSQAFRQNEFSKQLIKASKTPDEIRVEMGAAVGNFSGKLAVRDFLFEIHSTDKPAICELNGQPMPLFSTKIEWENAPSGWFFDPTDRQGIAFVKTAPRPTDQAFNVVLKDFTIADAEPFFEKWIRLSPNPAATEIQLDGLEIFPVSRIEIMDSAGRVIQVFENPAAENGSLELPVGGLASGVFSVKLTGEKGVTTKRFVKI